MFKSVLLLLSAFCLFSICAGQGVTDRLGDIANQAPTLRRNLLVTPMPPVLPQKYLSQENIPRAAFKAVEKIDNQQKLNAELAKMHNRYEQFLQDLAPFQQAMRNRVYLKEFNWRIGTNEDAAAILRVFQGKGRWSKISIPHYGPPLGKATTYYITSLSVTEDMLTGKALYIHFNGVDYKATVYLNGNYIGNHEGFFAPFEFDCSEVAHIGKNQLVVKVENDVPISNNGSKIYAATGPGYNDPENGWHHCPPGMGIYQNVYLEVRNKIFINDVFVRPKGMTDSAELWVEINNTSLKARQVTLQLSVYGQNFKKTIYQGKSYRPESVHVPGIGDLAKATDNEHVILEMVNGLNYLRIPIHLPNARRWTPDTPWLYQAQLSLINEEGHTEDNYKVQFGMREFRMDTLNTPKGRFYLNGIQMKLRGANDMGAIQKPIMQSNYDKLIDLILLAKTCHLNFIRLTQRPVQEEVYTFCDRLGLMTQTDLPLFGKLKRDKVLEAVKQCGEMEALVRKHPCNIIDTYINERFPNADGYPQIHLSTIDEYERFFSAANEVIHLLNPDRVIKPGDGDYDPPSSGLPDNHCYNGWYNGHGLGLGAMNKGYWIPVKPNWNYACGEFGSEGLDDYNTMRKHYPNSWLPRALNDMWTPKKISQSQSYNYHFMWYNTPRTILEWIKSSQDHQAWVTQLTTEAFRRNNSMVSFAIHLFQDAWPAGWMKAIVDVDGHAKPAFFKYRNALAPVMVSLRKDRDKFFSGESVKIEAWTSNDLNEKFNNVTFKYQWEKAGRVVWSSTDQGTINPFTSQFQGYIAYQLPKVNNRTKLTLRLLAQNKSGQIIDETTTVVEVFPVKKQATLPTICLLSKPNDTTLRSLAKALHSSLISINELKNADQIWISDYEQYHKQVRLIDSLVKGGKRVLFMGLPAGSYSISGDEVLVKNFKMGSYFFVENTTGHPFLKDSRPDDFKYWYNEKEGYPTPHLPASFAAESWNPILTSGEERWGKNSDISMAAAEKRIGKGRYIINELELKDRIATNPTAYNYLLKLMGL